MVAEKAASILSTAADLQEADEYKRLRTTLQERGFIDVGAGQGPRLVMGTTATPSVRS